MHPLRLDRRFDRVVTVVVGVLEDRCPCPCPLVGLAVMSTMLCARTLWTLIGAYWTLIGALLTLIGAVLTLQSDSRDDGFFGPVCVFTLTVTRAAAASGQVRNLHEAQCAFWDKHVALSPVDASAMAGRPEDGHRHSWGAKLVQ